jgi:AcrR family transcriptional regulator
MPERSLEFIVEVATALFAERGVAEVTLEDIAKRAEISPCLMTYYFKSKANMLFIVSRLYFSRLHRELTVAVGAAKTPLKSVHAFIDTFFRVANENMNYPVFLSKYDPFLQLDLTTYPTCELVLIRDRIINLLCDCIMDGIMMQEFNYVQADSFSYLIMSILRGTCRMYATDVDTDEVSHEIKSMLTYRLTGSLAREAAMNA